MNEWLKGLVAWAETLKLHETMQNVSWMVPAVQSVHILAISAVFASSMVLSLRIVHVSGIDWSPARWGQRLNAWVWTGLVILLVSGSVLIIGEPARSLLNWTFQLKMLLVVSAVVVLVALTHRLRHLNPPERTGGIEKLLAVVLVLLWMAIISCGRWIAYS